MKYRHLILLLIVFASCLYGLTWSARPTWVHFGEDGPELEAAGRVLGIPHPTGYPLLLLLVRVVSLGVRPPVSALNVVTLLAAILAVAAVGAAGRALARKVWKGEDGVSFWAGLAAGVFFAVSLTWWRQAVIGEVYPLHVALIAVALALLVEGGARRRLLAAYLLGLGLAHHLEMVPFLAVAAVYSWLYGRRRPAARTVLALVAPLTLYLVLVIRSRWDPPLDWGNPETLGGLWWVVSGAPYHGRLLEGGWRLFAERAGDASTVGVVSQVGWGAVALAGLGLMILAGKAIREAALLGMLFAGTIAVAAAYSIPDPAAYYLPAVLAVSLAAGVGSGALVRASSRLGGRRRWRIVPVAAAAGILVAMAAGRISTVAPRADARGRDDGYRYARDALAVLPPDALVLSHGDGRTFSLWYATTVLASRPDVVILYDNLLGWDWYRRLLHRAHPHLALPPRGLPRSVLRGAILRRYRDERPVFTTELEPELEPLFRVTPRGPLFRVERGTAGPAVGAAKPGGPSFPRAARTADPGRGATAAASSDRRNTGGRPHRPG